MKKNIFILTKNKMKFILFKLFYTWHIRQQTVQYFRNQLYLIQCTFDAR